jgi:hypothetical protein
VGYRIRLDDGSVFSIPREIAVKGPKARKAWIDEKREGFTKIDGKKKKSNKKEEPAPVVVPESAEVDPEEEVEDK